VGLKLPSWLNADFVLRMNMDLRNLGPNIDFVISRPSDLEQFRSFLSAARTVSNGAFRDRGFIETAHPYLDLRLVEFLFSIPFDQKVRPGQTRSLMRRALQDLLPGKVLIRRSKRGPEEAFFRAVRREWPWLRLLFEKPLVCSRGYMNARRLQAALDRARHGCELQSFALIKTISLEFWLRALEQRGSSANNLAVRTTLERVRSW